MSEHEEEHKHIYDITMETGLDHEDGTPMVLLGVVLLHGEEKEVAGSVKPVMWTATQARTFAINLLMATFDVEARASVIPGMRAHKLDEDMINGVLREIDTITHARRMAG